MDIVLNETFCLYDVVPQFVLCGWNSMIVSLECSEPCTVVVKSDEYFHHSAVFPDLIVYPFAESSDSAKEIDAGNYVGCDFLYCERSVFQ